jgi:hypothetical protein
LEFPNLIRRPYHEVLQTVRLPVTVAEPFVTETVPVE